MQRVLRYCLKCTQIKLFKQIFNNILSVSSSGPDEYFSNPMLALKPWVQACRFEYNKTNNEKNFFRLINGSWNFKSKLLVFLKNVFWTQFCTAYCSKHFYYLKLNTISITRRSLTDIWTKICQAELKLFNKIWKLWNKIKLLLSKWNMVVVFDSIV